MTENGFAPAPRDTSALPDDLASPPRDRRSIVAQVGVIALGLGLLAGLGLAAYGLTLV